MLSSIAPSRAHKLHGLENLGQTCYFNSIVQCLFHCPLFREAIENVPHRVLSVAVIRELRLLFIQMAKKSSLKYLETLQCFSAAISIPECKNANMSKTRQEDACEFFDRLIEYFGTKFKPLADIFEGDLRSTLMCQHCYPILKKTPSDSSLSLFPHVTTSTIFHTRTTYMTSWITLSNRRLSMGTIAHIALINIQPRKLLISSPRRKFLCSN